MDDLLDAARVLNGEMVLEQDIIDVGSIVRHTVDDHRGLSKSLRLALEVSLFGDPVWVHGDAARLAQALASLLRNAFRVSPRGGTVRVSLGASEFHAEIRIRDNGIGIDPSDQDRPALPCLHGVQGAARGHGLGLGLALVKGLVELHGGHVRVHSEGRGQGSELVVTLPLARAPGARAPETCIEPEIRRVGRSTPSASDGTAGALCTG